MENTITKNLRTTKLTAVTRNLYNIKYYARLLKLLFAFRIHIICFSFIFR